MIEVVDYSAITDQREFVCGDIHIRTSGSPLDRGAVVKAHAHENPHASFVMRGSFHVRTDDSDAIYVAPSVFLVRAGVRHEIESLEDGSMFWCASAYLEANQ